jgi:hypothetical protein
MRHPLYAPLLTTVQSLSAIVLFSTALSARADQMDFFGVVSGAYAPSDTNLLNKLPVTTVQSGPTTLYNLSTRSGPGTIGNGGATVSSPIGTTTTVFATTPLVFEVDYYAQVSNLTPNFGFGAVAFAADHSGALTIPISRPIDYAPDTSKVPSGAPYWSENADSGNQLHAMVATPDTIPPAPFPAGDPRITLGQGSAAYVGSIYLLWDGATTSTLTVGDTAGHDGMIQFSTLNEVTAVLGNAQFQADPHTIIFQTPEPGSLLLSGFGATVLFARRRTATAKTPN